MTSTLILLALLGSSPALPGRSAAEVRIERVAPATWRATYHFAAPVRTLRFERAAAFHRGRVWRLVTPGYHLARAGDDEIATLDSAGTARATIAFEFPPFADPLPKEYELFQRFTDGAVSIYTGHFRAVGITASDSAPVRTVRIVPPPGSRAIVRGRVASGSVTFADSAGEGTYIYVGRARPITTADVTAIIDPGMPAWLADMQATQLPRLFAAYTKDFGAPLPWKPTVLYSYQPDEQTGYSSGGGTLTGLLAMTVTGIAWRERNAGAAEQAFALLAHESAHLWNGQLVSPADDPAMAWMHEGNADAMAEAMLLSFGVVDEARARLRQEATLNRCAAALAAGSVATALRRGATRTVYDCGVVMALWTTAALRQVRPGATLAEFWRALITAAQRHGGRYDDTLYFATLREQGVADGTIARMREFLSATGGAPIAIDGLRASGVAVEALDVPPPGIDQGDYVRTAFVALMQQACGGKVSFTMGSPLRTGAIAGCGPFATAHAVAMVQGLRLRDQGAAVHDAIAAQCAAGRAVSLQDDQGTELVAVPCTRPLAPRGPWWRPGALIAY